MALDVSPIVSAAAVRDDTPLPDDWALVVRLTGTVPPSMPYIKTRYDITSATIYIGFAPRATTDAAADWLIRRIQFTSGNPTVSEWSDAGAVWNDRAITTYS